MATDWAKIAIEAERKSPSVLPRNSTSLRTLGPRRKATRGDMAFTPRKKGQPRRTRKDLFVLKLCGDNKIAMPLWSRRSQHFPKLYRACQNDSKFYRRLCDVRDTEAFASIIEEALRLAMAEPEKFKRKSGRLSPRALAREKKYLQQVAMNMRESRDAISFVRNAKVNTGESFLRRATIIMQELACWEDELLLMDFHDYAFQKLVAAGKIDLAAKLPMVTAKLFSD